MNNEYRIHALFVFCRLQRWDKSFEEYWTGFVRGVQSVANNFGTRKQAQKSIAHIREGVEELLKMSRTDVEAEFEKLSKSQQSLLKNQLIVIDDPSYREFCKTFLENK
jgi:hypothetical protein